MPVPVSSLSEVCESVRDFVATGIDATVNGVDVTIGAPAAIEDEDTHRLNLFFYRFEPSGFEAGAQPDLPWRIRMFCLVSPFGIDEAVDGATVPAGENDMRLLGDVMRLFHEQPILPQITTGTEDVRTRVVFMSTTDEQLNQIWSTQGDTHYRPSAVYEMSLTPVIPDEQAPIPAIVGQIGFEARANGSRSNPFTGVAVGPPVTPSGIDTTRVDWAPVLALFWNDELHRALSFDVDGAEFAGFAPEVLIAGETGAAVSLIWDAWRPTGWAASGAAIPATALGPRIDPFDIPVGAPGFPVAAPLPEALAPAADSLQLALHAERTFTRIDGTTGTVRSAPILITLYRTAP